LDLNNGASSLEIFMSVLNPVYDGEGKFILCEPRPIVNGEMSLKVTGIMSSKHAA
jgi:hypothetical protein